VNGSEAGPDGHAPRTLSASVEAALRRGAEDILARPLSEADVARSLRFLALLHRWGASQRLVGRRDPDWVVRGLFLDSLLFSKVLDPAPASVLDLGSGAGFPGVPLKIAFPETAVTLLEARRRRASFLRAVVRVMDVRGLRVVHARAESVALELAQRFDAVVTRCSGAPRAIIPLARRFVRPGGMAVLSGAEPDSTGLEGKPPPDLCERVSVAGLGPGTTRMFLVSRVE
jgi:16S rRNA (guanine527-N7)-methyltransferase